MPPRLERRQQTGDLHFITFSCFDRNPYLASADAKAAFEAVLERTRERHRFEIAGYVVMPEHVHLLVTEPPEFPLGEAIKVLKREVSRQRAQSPFWLRRYYDFNVFTNDKQVEKLRYMHRNPVTRGLVERPEEYVWSSFRAYAEGVVGRVTIRAKA